MTSPTTSPQRDEKNQLRIGLPISNEAVNRDPASSSSIEMRRKSDSATLMAEQMAIIAPSNSTRNPKRLTVRGASVPDLQIGHATGALFAAVDIESLSFPHN